jgi:hypothetical protein
MNKNKPSKIEETIKMERRVERRLRAENDPWFGKRRRAGEMGRHKTKAAASRNACRKRADW